MAIYDTISRRVWSDEKFLRLSDGAKLLWFRLLTGPEKLPIPGVVIAGQAQLAEAMGWSAKPFMERFRELSKAGMAKADWDGRIVWLPNAIRHRPPANPNVIKGWEDWWELVPECSLKEEIRQHLAASVTVRGREFADAWNGFANRLPNGMPNQEQEKEQEKEQEEDPPTPQGGGGVPPIPPELDTEEFRAAWADWQQHRREKRKKVTPTQAREAFREMAAWGPGRAVRAIRHSIAKGWTGMFEPDAKAIPPPAAPRNGVGMAERLRQRRTERGEDACDGTNSTGGPSGTPPPSG